MKMRPQLYQNHWDTHKKNAEFIDLSVSGKKKKDRLQIYNFMKISRFL